MSTWHALVDSDGFRTFSKRGAGRAVFRSASFRRLDTARRYTLGAYRAWRAPTQFSDVHTFVGFVGHNKSGSSLLGALLDAHPDVVLSDEVDALRYVAAGFPRDHVFTQALRGAATEARKGRVTARRLEPYSYAVPGQWQGRTERPLVVGDSTTGTTTRRLGADPALLERLERSMDPVRLRFLHVVRNPFDPISVMMVRGRRSFADAIDHYFTACDTLVSLSRRIGPDRITSVRYEDVTAAPASTLRRVCDFVGVDVPEGYLDACSSLVRPAPVRDRTRVRWPTARVSAVEARMTDYDFLAGYGYGH
jgi:hypothetical protein